MNRFIAFICFALFMTVAAGCSTGENLSPVSPPEVQSGQSNNEAYNGHALWGLYQCAFDPHEMAFEVIPLRGAQFHLNVTCKLQAPLPAGISLAINEFDKANGYIDLDLTIAHPFTYTNFRGFDVKGIIMGTGTTIPGKLDPGVKYLAPTGLKLKNADGYTRWWNAVEFTSPGLYGFTPGDLGMKYFTPQATLNPYKYFADVLTKNTLVVPNVNLLNRGTFSTNLSPAKLTRNYQIQFPMGGGGKPNYMFQYAIDANYAPPVGGNPTPKPISDFPLDANCPEAFHIRVATTGTTAWYKSGAEYGGDIVLSIEVFDWKAASNPAGINGEVQSIWLESATLFDSIISVDMAPDIGSQPVSGIYHATIPNVHPTGLQDQEILITVRSSNPASYAPPAGGHTYPAGAALAAFAKVEVPILNFSPTEAHIVVNTPNGGETWAVNGSGDIGWTSYGAVGNNVKIEYSINDGTPVSIINSTPNDSSYLWEPVTAPATDKAKIIVSSTDNPAITDKSDNFFTISSTAKTLTLTSPNGGESLKINGQWEIKWTSNPPGAIQNVALKLSKNGGLTYPTTIVALTPNDGSYLWNPVPGPETATAKIRVEWTNDNSVRDESNANFSINQLSTGPGWNPVAGQTGVKLTDPAPYQFTQPTDLGVFSAGASQSRGNIVSQSEDTNTFYKYNDNYSDVTGGSWLYPDIDVEIHKHDVLIGGDFVFCTIGNNDPWSPPEMADPSHCIWSSHNNNNGNYSFTTFGDSGPSGQKDPDLVPWWQIVDFSTGVPNGNTDNRAFFFMCNSPGWSPKNGRVGMLFWNPPYNNTSIGGWYVNCSSQGGGTGQINDTNPLVMAIGVDDNTGMTAGGAENMTAMWVLDSKHTAQALIVEWTTGTLIILDNKLDSEEYGSYGTPVDLEMANNYDFGYGGEGAGQQKIFNWICALLDKGNGNWSVGVWECDYLANSGEHAEFFLIDVTDPLPGNPMSIDFDYTDFEIHVLANNGGTIEATVFDYTPE